MAKISLHEIMVKTEESVEGLEKMFLGIHYCIGKFHDEVEKEIGKEEEKELFDYFGEQITRIMVSLDEIKVIAKDLQIPETLKQYVIGSIN